MQNQSISSKVTPMFARKIQTQKLADSKVVDLMMRPNPNFGCTTSMMNKSYNRYNWLTVVRSPEMDNLAA